MFFMEEIQKAGLLPTPLLSSEINPLLRMEASIKTETGWIPMLLKSIELHFLAYVFTEPNGT